MFFTTLFLVCESRLLVHHHMQAAATGTQSQRDGAGHQVVIYPLKEKYWL